MLLYRQVFEKLVHDWATDDNYSHGFLIVPLAAYFVWERRDRAARADSEAEPAGPGCVVAVGLAMLLAGLLGAELFLTRASLIPSSSTGAVLFVLGWQALPDAGVSAGVPAADDSDSGASSSIRSRFRLQLLASQVGEADAVGAQHSRAARRQRHRPRAHHASRSPRRAAASAR